MNFLASPTIVTAMAFSGKLSFNPMTDSLKLPSGESFKFNPPSGQDLPSSGFALGDMSYQPTPVPDPKPETEVIIRKDSQRLEVLEPFHSHFKDGSILELPKMKVLMRVRGKCTTDHISAAVSRPSLVVNTSSVQRPSSRVLGSSTRDICPISQRISVSSFSRYSTAGNDQSNFVICSSNYCESKRALCI
jgi:aconitase A